MADSFSIAAPFIETTALRLRALALDDAPEVFAYASDPEVARFTLWPPHKSEEFTRGFLRMLTGPAILSWAIASRESGDLLGIVFLHTLNKYHKRAEISFNVARSHWNKGIATEASRMVLRCSFTQLDLHRIEATCMPGNLGSRRVLEKLGMTHEGKLRRSHVRYDGFHDMDLFSILSDEMRD
jgi:[ribosomal protein S5]-alanine N-acetyltransferase